MLFIVLNSPFLNPLFEISILLKPNYPSNSATTNPPTLQDITTSAESPFFEIRQAIKNNKIALADEMGVDDDQLDRYVMDKVRGGGWITIGSNEDIAVSRHAGFCNMIYMDVSLGLVRLFILLF